MQAIYWRFGMSGGHPPEPPGPSERKLYIRDLTYQGDTPLNPPVRANASFTSEMLSGMLNEMLSERSVEMLDEMPSRMLNEMISEMFDEMHNRMLSRMLDEMIPCRMSRLQLSTKTSAAAKQIRERHIIHCNNM